MTRRALCTDGDSLPTLGVVRSLGRAGWEVDVVARHHAPLAGTSTYCNQVVPCHDPVCDRHGYVQSVIDLLTEKPYDLLVPVTDWSIVPLLDVREELEKRTTVALASSEAVRTTLSKSATMDLAARQGVPTPRTWSIRTKEDWARAADEVSLPAVVKADASKSWDTEGVGWHHPAVYGLTISEASQHVMRLLWHGPVVVQEHLRGDGVGVAALARDGEPLVLFQYRRIHEVPVSGGASSYRASEPLDPRLASLARRLLAGLSWTGVAMLEFKHNRQTDAIHLLEINGRYWGSLHLPMSCGVDFPRYHAEMLLDGRRQFDTEYRLGVRNRVLLHEASWLKDVLKRGSDPALARYPSAKTVVAEMLRLVDPRENWDTLVADDPVPGIESAVRLVVNELSNARLQARKLVALGHQGLSRRRRSALMKRVRSARSVLVVCSGNIVRSVWGELWLTRRLAGTGIAVGSAGVWARDGRRPHERVVAYAAEQGIDAGEHQATRLTKELMKEADLVLVMEAAHLVAIRNSFGRLARKAILTGALAEAGPLEIPDPVAGTDDELRAALRRLEECLELGWPNRS